MCGVRHEFEETFSCLGTAGTSKRAIRGESACARTRGKAKARAQRRSQSCWRWSPPWALSAQSVDVVPNSRLAAALTARAGAQGLLQGRQAVAVFVEVDVRVAACEQLHPATVAEGGELRDLRAELREEIKPLGVALPGRRPVHRNDDQHPLVVALEGRAACSPCLGSMPLGAVRRRGPGRQRGATTRPAAMSRHLRIAALCV